MIDEWKPPTEPINEWIPPTKPINPPEEESFLSKARDFMFNPLLPKIEPTKEELAFGRDIPGLNKIYPGGIPLPNVRGIYNELIRPVSAPIGLLTLGMEGLINRPRPVPETPELPVRAPRLLTTRLPEQPEAPVNTRFIHGEAGTAESGKTYPIDLGPSQIPNPSQQTILPREYGEVNQIPANLAARQGLEIGKPARAPLGDRYSGLPYQKRLEAKPEIKELPAGEGFTDYKGNILPTAKDMLDVSAPGPKPELFKSEWIPPTEPVARAPISEPVTEPVKSQQKPINQILEDFQKSLREKNILKPKLQEEAIPELSPVQKVVSTLKDLVSQEEGSVDVERMKKLLKDNAKLFGNMDWYKTALAKIDDGEYESASRLIKSGLTSPGDSKISYRDLVKRYANFDGNRNKVAPIGPDTEIYQRPEELPAVQKLMAAMNEAGPQREQQEQLYSMERARRFNAAESIKTPGLEGFYKQLSKMKGELPKVKPQQYGLTESDIDSLIDTVTNSRRISPGGEKMHAKTGLLKLLSGTEVPQKNELQLLSEVFGDEFANSIENFRGGIGGPVPIRTLVKTNGLMKSLLSSVDVSWPLRQGLPMALRSEFWSALKDTPKFATSQEFYDAMRESIVDRPLYLSGRKAGLKLTGIGKNYQTAEEHFPSSLPGKIPLFGTLYRGSERAYVGPLNKLRADVYDSMYEAVKNAGGDVSLGSQATKQIAQYVNNFTGRGDLGRAEKIGAELNAVFFSPRMIKSRLFMLNPTYYTDPNLNPIVRKEALKSLLAIGGFTTLMLGMNKIMGGTTSNDILDTDFLKMVHGNTRQETMAGLQSYVVAAARLVMGQTDKGQKSRWEIGDRFVTNKLGPLGSLTSTFLRSKVVTDRFGNQKRVDQFGNELNLTEEVIRKFPPMLMQDLYDIYQSDPNLLPLGIGAALGQGTTTYEKNDKPLSQRLHWRE